MLGISYNRSVKIRGKHAAMGSYHSIHGAADDLLQCDHSGGVYIIVLLRMHPNNPQSWRIPALCHTVWQLKH